MKQSNIEIVKQRLEEEYQDIVAEHKAMKKDIFEIRREAEKHKADKIMVEDDLHELENKFSKMLKDFERSASLLHE